MMSNLRGRALSFTSTIGNIAITLLGLAALTFFIGRAMPIDPARAILGDRAPAQVVEALRSELGLDKPLWQQFGIYLRDLAGGDLGTSVVTQRPVLEDVIRYFPATLELATTALIISLIVGIPLGVMAAARQGRLVDHVVRVLSLVGQSTPVFVIAFIALLVFYVQLGIAPGAGRQDIIYQGMVPERTHLLLVDTILDGQWDAFRDAVAHLAMPALLLALYSISTIARMTRTFMIDTLSEEYIIAARGRGFSEGRILWLHAFPVIIGKLASVIALVYAGLLEGSVLTETIFTWPGLGLYLTSSLLNADMNAVLGATLVVGSVYVMLNLVADGIYYLADPRVGARSR